MCTAHTSVTITAPARSFSQVRWVCAVVVVQTLVLHANANLPRPGQSIASGALSGPLRSQDVEVVASRATGATGRPRASRATAATVGHRRPGQQGQQQRQGRREALLVEKARQRCIDHQGPVVRANPGQEEDMGNPRLEHKEKRSDSLGTERQWRHDLWNS